MSGYEKTELLEDVHEVVTDDEFVNELALWYCKGHNPLHQIKIFGNDEVTGIGISSYIDPFRTLHISKEYSNHQHAFSKLGALFDKLEKRGGR